LSHAFSKNIEMVQTNVTTRHLLIDL